MELCGDLLLELVGLKTSSSSLAFVVDPNLNFSGTSNLKSCLGVLECT